MQLPIEFEDFSDNGNRSVKVLGGGVPRHQLIPVTYADVASLENLLIAWYEFHKGKRARWDVQAFEFDLEYNIFQLNRELLNGSYSPDPYSQFRINDPKPRVISKATVRDRLAHHAIYRLLYPYFDKTFIFDSYSCRVEKGTHKAFARLQQQIRKCSKNYTKPCFALKCDIRKFFDTVDHTILLDLLAKKVEDTQVLSLLEQIISSFEVQPGKGMPIGNLTSQLFANVYMDPLDKFVKNILKATYYLRYADDFLILANSESELMGYFVEIWRFLKEELELNLHPNKISLRKLACGIDFVGYVARPHYTIPRRTTVRRMLKKVSDEQDLEKLPAILDSYIGYLSHANAPKIDGTLRLKVLERIASYD